MLYIEWSKSERQMKVINDIESWYARVSCVVRNDLNGWRPNPKKVPKDEVVHMITKDNRESNVPVMPRTFPVGKWNILWIEARTNPYQRPFFIATDAFQPLDVWMLDENGGYSRKAGHTIMDYMYGLHYSSSNTTQGCIKIHNLDDLDRLVEEINLELEKGIKPMIEVVA